jgi:hypothetical protein
MTDFVLSPSLVPNGAEWSLIDFSGVQQSVLSGATRTVSRGQRWQARLNWYNLIGDNRAYLSALMASLRGKSNRIWIPDPTYRQRGSFPAPELLTNGDFVNGATGWTAGGNCTLSGHNRTLRLSMIGVTAPYAYQSVSVVSGVAYAMRSCLVDAVGSGSDTLGVRMSDGSNNYDSVSSSARGLITVAGVAGASAAGNQRIIYVSSGASSGEAVFCTYASLRRCALAVNPTSLTTFYTSLPIDALPINTNGLLRAGDRVEVNGEMKSVTFDLNSDGSGAGMLFFEPALRKFVPDNAPIIIGEPMMKGIFTDGAVQVSRPGVNLLSDFDFTFVEAS